MHSERLVFSNAMESLLKASRGRVSPAVVEKLKSMGVSYDRSLAPAYPAELWARAVSEISADLFPNDPPLVQHNKLGRLTVTQFAETMMGRAMFAAAKVFGARRSLERMTRNLRTGSNFIETRFTEVNPHTHELWISDVSGVPGFYAGLVEAGGDFLPGWVQEMRIKQLAGPSCTYELRNDSLPRA